MVKSIFVVLLSIFLIILLGFVLYEFLADFYTINNVFVQIGVGIILIFTSLVILRYMLLLFFSMLKIIFKTSDEKKEENQLNFNKKISVIIPAYNEEAVIDKSIRSILNQTYPNKEIIVVDDGSTDRTYKIASKFTIYPNVKVLTKKNEGKAKAINYGINNSSGELILVVDADSKLEKNAMQLLANYFKDPHIAAVAGSVYVANQDNLWTKLQTLEYIEGLNMVRNGQALLKLVNIIPGPIGMFRKMEIGKKAIYYTLQKAWKNLQNC